MLNISIAKLEQARQNTQAFAKSLSQAAKGFGTNGSFSGIFKSFIGKFHNDNENKGKFHTQLQDAYKLQFIENSVNNKRAKKYCEAFSSYSDYMMKNGFGLDNFFTRINLKLLADVSLGGNSPILSSSDTRNMVFSIEESPRDWQNELKYPILQRYLAENYYSCEKNQVEIGIFNVNSGLFELKIFDDIEIANAFEEAKTVLGNVKYILDQS
ncbi:hypothetical protein SAMN05421827_1386 [Pedobacter terrae]|uniref:Uncharacterized protein n=1 Tax=Pedobacter terrae TaxID=405671 RepID=A0A1G8EGH6_9SPHI|nr:hypothetical protein [Pedobacter terrae]SDH68916.1 hypothetical protein SAMN05421827_1386 [Pedobacter terrae]